MKKTRSLKWSRHGRNTYTAYILMNGTPAYIAVNIKSKVIGIRIDVPFPNDMPVQDGIRLEDGTVYIMRRCLDLDTQAILAIVYTTIQSTGILSTQATA